MERDREREGEKESVDEDAKPEAANFLNQQQRQSGTRKYQKNLSTFLVLLIDPPLIFLKSFPDV